MTPSLPASCFSYEVTVFRTRHSISMSCLYIWTSLAPRLDKKKVHISLLNIACLNFTSLHSRPPAPNSLTSTPQTSTQKTSTQLTSAPLRKPHINQPQLNSANLNSTHLNSSNLDSTNLHLLTSHFIPKVTLDSDVSTIIFLLGFFDNKKLCISPLIRSRLHDPTL